MQAPAPHRLRDLDRRGRLIAVLVGALLLVPVATSVGRALAADWRPSNDDALIVLQARDVLSTDPPLVGQPSTADTYVEGNSARHPGPIEFYLLALPIRVLGHTLGTLLTAAALAGTAVLLTAWIAFRRGGPAVGLGAAVLLALAMWSSGTAVLSDPISSNVGGYPLIAAAALAWSLWCDDRRLWPLAVAVWSFTIQQHLAVFGLAGTVAAWGVAGAAVTTLRHRAEVGRLAATARTAALAAVVGLVLWLPPLVDQIAGSGNLHRMVAFSGADDRPTLGLGAGLRAAGRAVGAPPILVSRSLAVDHVGGWDLIADLGGAAVGVAVGLVAALGAAALAVRAWRRDPAGTGPARLALLGTAAVVALAGVVTTANVPGSFEAPRINFYRWVWPVSLAVWGAMAWTAGEALARARRRRGDGPAWLPAAGVATAVVALAAVVVATSTRVDEGDQRRDEQVFWFEAETEAAVRAAAPEGVPVRVLMDGVSAFISQGPALSAALAEAGYEVRVEPRDAAGWGDRRAVAPAPGEEETVVWVLSGAGGVPPLGEGDLVARGTLPRHPGGVTDSWREDTFEVWVAPPD